MKNKLSTLKTKCRKSKLSYMEVLEKLNQVQTILEEVIGPRASWDKDTIKTYETLRMIAIVKQLKDYDVGCQYETSID